MSAKSKGLTDRDRSVIATMRMRLKESEAMLYLKEEGYEMDARTWYRIKKKLKKDQLARLYFIAQIGFVDQHNTRIETCELLENLMWENYRKEESPFKKVLILKHIAELQPIISGYYDVTRAVLEKGQPGNKDANRNKQESNTVSANSS